MEKPNMPHNILPCLAAAAEILGISEEKIAENTTRNASRIFGLEV
jgi:Tat protein secretion system quality control protein TatD with DNase activity